MLQRLVRLFARQTVFIAALVVLCGPVVWLELDERYGIMMMCFVFLLSGAGIILEHRDERGFVRIATSSLGGMLLFTGALGVTYAVRALILG